MFFGILMFVLLICVSCSGYLFVILINKWTNVLKTIQSISHSL